MSTVKHKRGRTPFFSTTSNISLSTGKCVRFTGAAPVNFRFAYPFGVPKPRPSKTIRPARANAFTSNKLQSRHPLPELALRIIWISSTAFPAQVHTPYLRTYCEPIEPSHLPNDNAGEDTNCRFPPSFRTAIRLATLPSPRRQRLFPRRLRGIAVRPCRTSWVQSRR